MREKPIIYKSRSDVPDGTYIVDAFQTSLEELFFIEHPDLKHDIPETKNYLKDFLSHQTIEDIWIYFPWKKTAVRSVPEALYFKLRTARNKNIITVGEQQEYRTMIVGVAGLSVGSAAIAALAISGGPKCIKIADFDTVEVSNLNRMNATMLDVGTNKALVAARNVWEVDPFADIEVWDKGVGADTIQDFIKKDPRLNVFIDEMDALPLKIHSRILCKKFGIPVLMATDNGDGIVLDIERFDLEPERPIFHGLVEDMKDRDLNSIGYQEWLQLAAHIIGAEFLTERMQDSLLQIGKTIASVPQLGTSASLAGSALSYAVRCIANGKELRSGRYTINLEAQLDPEYYSSLKSDHRAKKTKKFIDQFASRLS